MISTYVFFATLWLTWFAFMWSSRTQANLVMKIFLIVSSIWGWICFGRIIYLFFHN
jgi:hypothetical protein